MNRPAKGRRLLGSYFYRRVMLAFRVDADRLDARLPPGWRSVDHEGWGNVVAGFCEVHAYADPAGATIPDALRYYVPVNGVAFHAETGAEANFRYVTFADGRNPFPGCGARLCRVEHRLEVDGPVLYERMRYEGEGDELLLDLVYERGTAERGSGEMAVRCPDDPAISLVYANDELQDTVYSRTGGADRRRSFAYALRSPALADLFDGSEELEAVVAVPASERRVLAV